MTNYFKKYPIHREKTIYAHLIAWIEKGVLTSPMENLCPSTVQMETPQESLEALAN